MFKCCNFLCVFVIFMSHVIFKFLCVLLTGSPLSPLEAPPTLNYPKMLKAYFVKKHSNLIGTLAERTFNSDGNHCLHFKMFRWYNF